MNHTEVFVVVASQGQWEDSRQWIELITYSSVKAELYIADKLAKFKAEQKIYERVSSWRTQYHESNPYPVLDKARWKDRRRWPAGLKEAQITPEMKAERDSVAAHNQIVSDEHTAQFNVWQAEYDKACLDFIASEFEVDAIEQERISKLRYRDQVHFEIEKHPIES